MLNTADLSRFLRSLPEFERLGEPSVDALALEMQVEEYPAGHALVTQGGCGAAMHVVLTGRLEVTRTEAGALTSEYGETRELAKGSIIGLLSFADIPGLDTCRCKETVHVATLSRKSFDVLFSLAPAVARLIQYMLAVRLAQVLQAQNRILRETLHASTLKRESLLKHWFGA